MADGGLFKYVDEGDERVKGVYSDTSEQLRREGLQSFLLPSLYCALLLIAIGWMCYFLFSFEGWICAALAVFGFCIAMTGTLLCAMHVRQARAARGCSLTITDRRVIYKGASIVELPLSDIRSVSTGTDGRFGRVPFDLSLLEGRYILLECECEQVRITRIRDTEDAAALIRSLLDKKRAL